MRHGKPLSSRPRQKCRGLYGGEIWVLDQSASQIAGSIPAPATTIHTKIFRKMNYYADSTFLSIAPVLVDGAKAIEELCERENFTEVQQLAKGGNMTEAQLLAKARTYLQKSPKINQRIAQIKKMKSV